MRATHWTTTPQTKAMATLTKMAMMTLRALSLLRSMSSDNDGSVIIFRTAMAKVPPSSPKTSDTVEEVGRPSVLNMSSTITFVTITARKMIMTSWNE